ncbi:MAG: sulfite exporter TauE/SafE family protein [Candidatus Thiodiazotropha sp. (ex Dulcina madagascariensis)]|nr:sulfite exporter TauE/SafE family protein [Candidatus Thiodiazotropha sp. (ex Dulcina madagascariensis)]
MAVSPELQLHLDILQGFGSVYLGVLAMGFFYGLTLCSFSCIPLIAPYIFGTQEGFKRGFDATAVFVLTRVMTYTLMGGLSGMLGAMLLTSMDSSWLLTLAGTLILLIGMRVMVKSTTACERKPASSVPFARRSWLHMATLGFSTSLVPCLPLSAVLLYAATTQSFVSGALLALVFGIGTSASPLYFIGGATGWLSEKIRIEIPRYQTLLRVISGIILASFGLRLLWLACISHTPPTAAAQWHALSGVRSVGVLDIVPAKLNGA